MIMMPCWGGQACRFMLCNARVLHGVYADVRDGSRHSHTEAEHHAQEAEGASLHLSEIQLQLGP